MQHFPQILIVTKYKRPCMPWRGHIVPTWILSLSLWWVWNYIVLEINDMFVRKNSQTNRLAIIHSLLMALQSPIASDLTSLRKVRFMTWKYNFPCIHNTFKEIETPLQLIFKLKCLTNIDTTYNQFKGKYII